MTPPPDDAPRLSRTWVWFGVGPRGALLTILILAVAVWIDRTWGPWRLGLPHRPVLAMASLLIDAGLMLHIWTMTTLRAWWTRRTLCTTGPFRWFRHPMYAAWITGILPGAALLTDSPALLCALIPVHGLWHFLVRSEERRMLAAFGDTYRAYAQSTGRFIPALRRR